MRIALWIFLIMVCWTSTRDLQIADIKYINGYYRSNGTYVNGHYRDTSNDGNPYNNADFLWGKQFEKTLDKIFNQV